MKLLHLYTILFFTLLGFSCRKKNYAENTVENTPIFYFKGTINNVPASFVAGVDDYYMFSSFTQDSNNVYNFTGVLKKTNCDKCANSLFVQLNDLKSSVRGASADVNSAITAKTYPVFNNTQNSYLVAFQSSYNRSGGTYLWDFGDGTTATGINPSHTYAQKGNYRITLQITGAGANPCISTVSYISKIGETNKCETAIDATVSGDSVQYSQSTKGVGPFKYLWSFGDGATSSLPNPLHWYTVKGGRPAILRVIDAANDTAVANYNVVTGGDASSCAANFKITSVSSAGGTGAYGLSSAIINWYDASGKLYTSKEVLQPSDSYFEVLSVEDYEPNENNLRTKKMKVRFKCTVYNGTEFLKIDNVEAVVAVAYN